MAHQKETLNEKAQEILDVAQALIQTRGYNGFSFRDVASEVGIKSASIHYHFPTKADLAVAVAAGYRKAFNGSLTELSSSSEDAAALLRGYGSFFFKTLSDQGRVCLAGILASDAGALPDDVRSETTVFFKEQHDWISEVISMGQANGTIKPDIDPMAFAKTFLAGLEGAMIIARSTQSPQDLSDTVEQLITLVTV